MKREDFAGREGRRRTSEDEAGRLRWARRSTSLSAKDDVERQTWTEVSTRC